MGAQALFGFLQRDKNFKIAVHNMSLVKNAACPVSRKGLVTGLLTPIPEEVVQIRRIDGLPRFSNFIFNKLHRMNGAGPYFDFLGGTCGD